MKKLISIILSLHASLFTPHAGEAQVCLPEGITFETQAQIDSFQVNYPGCTEIEGDVVIGPEYQPSGNITHLDGLSVLNSIGGSLTIRYDSALTSLGGLHNLYSIGGMLSIYGNASLENIYSLGSLTIVGDGLEIGIIDWWAGEIGNPSLASLAGLEGLTSLNGLSIIGNYLIEDLTGLNNLTYLGGLFLAGNSTLSDLSALENLTEINGSLGLGYNNDWGCVGNPSLLSLEGLNGLSAINGNLVFMGSSLNTMNGLDNLIIIGNDFILQDNYSLVNLDGLNNIVSIGGKFLIGQYPGIGGTGHVPGGNPLLESFTGIENLASIGGDLVIGYNDTLASLAGMENIISIGGDMIIHDNESLTTLDGLNNVNYGSIHNLLIHNNPLLSQCEAQGICTYLSSPNGSVDIYNNADGCNDPPQVAEGCGITLPCLPYGNYRFRSQASIDSFPTDYTECDFLGGDVSISGSDIVNLYPFNTITFVGGSLSISYNDLLTNLDGLENISSVGGDLKIRQNMHLTSIEGLENLDGIAGKLDIRNNSNLTSLSGLNNLETIGSWLQISGNNLQSIDGLASLKSVGPLFNLSDEDIENLSGLESLSTIGGTLTLAYLPFLEDLSALSNLDTVAGTLSIHNNNSLTSLAGLDNLDPGSIFNLYISSNSSLSECAVISICEYLASPGGEITIQNNATGCDSPKEVEAACGVGVETPPVQSSEFKVQSYPNPTGGISHFAFRISQSQGVSLKIYNPHGQIVALVLDEVMPAGEHVVNWDAGRLPAGIYYYRLTTDDYRLTTGKIVKY